MCGGKGSWFASKSVSLSLLPLSDTPVGILKAPMLGRSSNFGEVPEVSGWTGQGLLALQAARVSEGQAYRVWSSWRCPRHQGRPGLSPLCWEVQIAPSLSNPCPSISWRGDLSSFLAGLCPGSARWCELPKGRVRVEGCGLGVQGCRTWHARAREYQGRHFLNGEAKIQRGEVTCLK